jgi:hypothetical protein
MVIEGELRRPDNSISGSTTWLKNDLNDSGEITRIIGVNQDITERKEMEIALKKVSRSIEALPIVSRISFLQWMRTCGTSSGIRRQNNLRDSIGKCTWKNNIPDLSGRGCKTIN